MTVVTLDIPYVGIKFLINTCDLCTGHYCRLKVFITRNSVSRKGVLPSLVAQGNNFVLNNLYTVKP